MIRNFLELVERSHHGPTVAREDWDIDGVIMPIQERVERYQLARPEGQLVADDEALLDRYYVAARDLLIEVGVYNQSTSRVIRFSAAEVDEAARLQRQAVTVGEGGDAYTFVARHAEDPRRPGVVAGNPGCPMDERVFRATVRSWAGEPTVDMVTCGSLTTIDGFPVRRGEPSELVAVRRELRILNEVTAAFGRPGIGRLAAESSASEVGDLAAQAPGLIRSSDAHLVTLNNELMTNTDNLVRAASKLDTGILNASLACVMVGGMAGGVAGATLCMMTSMLAANLVCLADYHLCHPIHIHQIATSAPDCLWLQSVVAQSFARNAPQVIIGDIYPKSGAGTIELLREVAANAAVLTVSGAHLEGVGSCDGLKPHCSGLESRLMGEVGRAVTRSGMRRADVETLAQALLSGYESILQTGNEGRHFDEVWDAATNAPAPEWLGLYDQMRGELRELGLEL